MGAFRRPTASRETRRAPSSSSQRTATFHAAGTSADSLAYSLASKGKKRKGNPSLATLPPPPPATRCYALRTAEAALGRGGGSGREELDGAARQAQPCNAGGGE